MEMRLTVFPQEEEEEWRQSQATRRGGFPVTVTAAALTKSLLSSTASISSTSIRNPRSFTCVKPLLKALFEALFRAV